MWINLNFILLASKTSQPNCYQVDEITSCIFGSGFERSNARTPAAPSMLRAASAGRASPAVIAVQKNNPKSEYEVQYVRRARD
jgi:hypothetical protein